jgi:hypothetical protein
METETFLEIEEPAKGHKIPKGIKDWAAEYFQKKNVQPRFAAGGGSFKGVITRAIGVLSALTMASGFYSEYHQAKRTGIYTDLFGQSRILDTQAAAATLGDGTVVVYTDSQGKSQFYNVTNGAFVRGGCDSQRENCGIQNPGGGSFSVVRPWEGPF